MTRQLSDFEGAWVFSRRIVHQSGDQAVCEGQAVFSKASYGLRYDETGEISINGSAPMTATRSYLWHEDLSMFFEDGRFFHQVPALGGTAAHWCDPDSYQVEYDFEDWPHWSTCWTVTGPRKDYEMVTRYQRPWTNQPLRQNNVCVTTSGAP